MSGVRLSMLKLQEGNKPRYLRFADAIRTAIDERWIGPRASSTANVWAHTLGRVELYRRELPNWLSKIPAVAWPSDSIRDVMRR